MTSHTLFSVTGIEIEYMIVDNQTLDVMPIADKILEALCGKISGDYEEGPIAVNNELALHVIELKTNGPVADLQTLANDFAVMIERINRLLAPYKACLMPTGAHPWFTPSKGFKLWPHGDHVIYDTYNKLFGCSGHGWTNLQSTHINLPFANDAEFVSLHNAIRLLLPLLPTLTSSTPFIEGEKTGLINSRLSYYGKNQEKCPIISGEIVPEQVSSIQEYQDVILSPIYTAIRSLDDSGTLEYEWLNSRGAIARFDRNAIEIRIVDSQECPNADIAIVEFITIILKELVKNKNQIAYSEIKQSALVNFYRSCYQSGATALIDNTHYLAAFGIHEESLTAATLWKLLFEKHQARLSKNAKHIINVILQNGNLSERLLTAYENHESQFDIYTKLVSCLKNNKVFIP